MQRIASRAAPLLLAAILGLGASHLAAAQSLRDVFGGVVKVVGIGFLVRQFGPEIDRAINTVLFQRGVRWEGKTKVVPSISAGTGAYVGAAQVQGPPSQVDQVRYAAIAEIPVGRFRGRGVFPVRSLTPGKPGFIRTVPGTGVTALIDFRI